MPRHSDGSGPGTFYQLAGVLPGRAIRLVRLLSVYNAHLVRLNVSFSLIAF